MKSRKLSVRLPLGLNEFIEKEVLTENTTISKWVISALEKVKAKTEIEKNVSIIKKETLIAESTEVTEFTEERDWSVVLFLALTLALIYGLINRFIKA